MAGDYYQVPGNSYSLAGYYIIQIVFYFTLVYFTGIIFYPPAD